MPTPVHDIAHSDRALLLMNVMQFMDDNSADYDDAYGDEVQLQLDISVRVTVNTLVLPRCNDSWIWSISNPKRLRLDPRFDRALPRSPN